MRIRQISVNPKTGMASLALQSTAPSAATRAAVMTLATGDDVEDRKGYNEADNGNHKSLESTGLKDSLVLGHVHKYANEMTGAQDG
jgi:hypothetical protein